MKKIFLIYLSIVAVSMIGFFGCDDDSNAQGDYTFSIGGTANGLTGQVILQLDSNTASVQEALVVPGDGNFVFSTRLPDSTEYNVAVKSKPDSVTCSIGNACGISVTDVNNLHLVCSSEKHSISGKVMQLTGSAGGLVLENNCGDGITLKEDGNFTFSKPVAKGVEYNVTIKEQPLPCTVNLGSGVADVDVDDVIVVCSAEAYGIGGTVTGLTGTMVLQNNGDDPLAVDNNGSFKFSRPVPKDAAYSVTFRQYPSFQSCYVTNGSGTASGPVSNIKVNCSKKANVIYTVASMSGSIPGASGTPRYRIDYYCSNFAGRPGGFYYYRGFLSTSASDEIRNMPTLYAVPTDVMIAGPTNIKIADNWADLMDGTIDRTLRGAGVTADYYWWSGSTATGAFDATKNCNGWTSQSASAYGARGYMDATSGNWISTTISGGDPSDGSCDEKLGFFCMAFDPPGSSVGAYILSKSHRPRLILVISAIVIIIAVGVICGIAVYRRRLKK